jgi:NTP pyrophosphatase (non-canonical NTP hydrolase)
VHNGARQEELEDEAADVLFSLFSICDSYNVDLQSVYSEKNVQEQPLANTANIKLSNILSLFKAVGVLSKEIMEIEMYDGLRQKELEGRIADFFSSLLSVCDLYKIDLLVAYSRKIEKISKKIPEWHEKYGSHLKHLREKFD